MQYLFASFTHQRIEGMEAANMVLSFDETEKIEERLRCQVETIHHLHSSFLQVMTTWVMLEKERAAKLIGPSPTPLYDDVLLRELRLHSAFAAVCDRYPMLFDAERVERWYYAYRHRAIAPLEGEKKGSGQEDKAVLMRSLLKYLFKEQEIQGRAAQHDMGWQEDKGIVWQRLRRFVKDFLERPETSFACYDDSLRVDKADFYVQLIVKTLSRAEEHKALLQKSVDNWALERINLLDRTLIKMALTEIMCFPEIPEKVSINEYLEIAKQYSTPKSVSFINGIVDRIRQDRSLVKGEGKR